MTIRRASSMAALAILLGAMAAGAAGGADPPKGAAATIGDEVIPMAELDQRTAVGLAELERQRQKLREDALDQLIAERLVTREAQRRGVTVEALVQEEVTSKVKAVTDADVDAFIAQNRGRMPAGDPAALRPRVASFLQRQRTAERREQLLAGLRAQTPVKVFLVESEPVRATLDTSVGFARGPRDAAVTVVEFSDFQCPYCKAAVGTLKQVAAQYPDRVRWVFRDFPIAALHPDAPLAHEAARCVAEQGKFWAYHDALYERASDLSPASLKKHAEEVGADPVAFAQCLDSHRQRAAVAADIEAGAALGVTGTPTFFVNGRPLVGNQSFPDFQKLIERELARRPVP